MGKILFINGSPNENGCVSTAMDEVIEVLNNDGIDTEKMRLIENGEKNDLSAPAHEIKTFTNFI